MHDSLSISHIAVVGASQTPTKLGTVIYNNILQGGFSGKTFPVNPNYPTIMGTQAYPSVDAIPEDIDTVIIVVPAEHVSGVVDDCIKKGTVKLVVVISAGFAEAGQEGIARQERLVRKCDAANIRLIGPNCLGVILPHQSLNASFASFLPKPGNIAFAAQSGAFATALLDMAAAENLGFASFITFGNKADLNELDLLQQWADDPQVKVIGMYLEGFVDGNDFVALSKKVNKPIVILKPGQSKQAAAAIASHTGSLAGPAATTAAALAAAGVIQVGTITDLYATMKLLALMPKSADGQNQRNYQGLAVLTNAGGPAVMVTDMIEEYGLTQVELTAETQATLKTQLPPASNLHNPIDILGDADAARYSFALQTLIQAAEVEAIMVLLTPQYVTQVEETAKAIAIVCHQSDKLILPVFIGGAQVQHGLDYFESQGIAAFTQPEHALQALSHLRKQSQLTAKSQSDAISPSYGPNVEHLRAVLKQLLPESGTVVVPGEMAGELARSVGITLPDEQIISTTEEAQAFAAKVNFPVVLKLTGPDALHKTEVKGLVLDIDSVEKLNAAFTDLFARAHSGQLLIQKQLSRGLELFIGADRDGGANVYTPEGKGFGHLLVFGSGGIYTEVYRDTANLLLPAGMDQFRELVQRTKAAQVISGARGKQKLALDALIHQLAAVSQLVQTYPEIKSLDINPLILTEDAAICVDLKLIVAN
jgi:acetate---CoA ligase (ADP-forming)